MLGCTHFPVLAAAIRQIIGKDVTMVDSAETTAAAVAEALAAHGMANDDGGSEASRMRFFATDSPERFARVGAIFSAAPSSPARSSWSTSASMRGPSIDKNVMLLRPWPLALPSPLEGEG